MEAFNCNLCNQPVEVFFTEKSYPLYVRPVPKESANEVPSCPIKIAFCSTCRHIMQVGPPSEDLLNEVYSKLYSTYHSTQKTGIGEKGAKNFLNFLVSHLSTKGTALEIGCGDGYFLSLLKSKGWEVYGCDPSPAAEEAKNIFGAENVKQDFFSKKLYEGTKFNLVVMRHLLEHIPYPISFLQEVSAILKPDALLAIEVPNVFTSLKEGVAGDFCHEHLSYFTSQSMAITLGKAGFAETNIKSEGPFLFAIALKTEPTPEQLVLEYANNLNRLRRELAVFFAEWGLEGKEIYIYGAGGHTTGLFNRVNDYRVNGVIDSDPSKWGKILPGIVKEIYPPGKLASLDYKNTVIIISSRVFQEEIAANL